MNWRCSPGQPVGPIALGEDGRKDLLASQFRAGQPRGLNDVLCGGGTRGGHYAAAKVPTKPELALPKLWLNQLFDVQKLGWLDEQTSLFVRFARSCFV